MVSKSYQKLDKIICHMFSKPNARYKPNGRKKNLALNFAQACSVLWRNRSRICQDTNELVRERERERAARAHRNGVNRIQCVRLISSHANEPPCIALHCMHAHWPHDWNSETSLAVAVPAAAAVAAAAPDGRARAAHQKGKHAAVQPFMGEMQCWIRSGQGAMQCWVCICRSATSTVSAKWLVRPPTGRRRTSPWETAEKGVSGNAVLLHTWQAPLFSSGAACKIRDAENHAKKNHRDSIVCAETFHPAKCTNTALGKPQTSFLPKKKKNKTKKNTNRKTTSIKTAVFTLISRQDQQGSRVETCFLPHSISSFISFYPDLAGNQPNPALLMAGCSEDAFGPRYHGPDRLLRLLPTNWPEPLLSLLLLSNMQQATAPGFSNPTNRRSHVKQKEPFNIQGGQTDLTEDLICLGMVHFFIRRDFDSDRVAGELTAQGKSMYQELE